MVNEIQKHRYEEQIYKGLVDLLIQHNVKKVSISFPKNSKESGLYNIQIYETIKGKRRKKGNFQIEGENPYVAGLTALNLAISNQVGFTQGEKLEIILGQDERYEASIR